MSLFFELLQVSLGRRRELSRVPSVDEWSSIFVEGKRQAVLGILFSGVEQLPESQRPSRPLMRRWMAYVQTIEARNAKMDARTLQLLKRLCRADLRATVLKGQGVARLYGAMTARRQCGDIDIYVEGGMKNAMRKVAPVLGRKWDYKHVELDIWKDTEVELHYRVEFIYSLLRNWRLQRWFAAHSDELFHTDGEWITPSLEMNLFYILLHIYRHYFYQGVGLRQIIDYYFVLQQFNSQHSTIDSQIARKAVKSFGMEHFARGLMWVMGEALAMPREWMLWPPDEREGRLILAQVVKDGNFGLDDRNAKSSALTLRHGLHMLHHYPAEILSAPLWMVYQRIWKKLCHI
ncbi:MAG: nucleotidyltransferase family protein [Bacteroidales bacterium]|nr:nucleotidyltransferase family protein [Bacteroidales bacterium]